MPNCNSCYQPIELCNCHPTDPCSQNEGCKTQLSTECIIYNMCSTGDSGLSCLALPNGTSLKDILEAMDAKLCNVNPFNFSIYTLPCLRADYTVTNFQQFAEAVDSELCTIKTSITTLNSTIQGQITSLQTQLDNICTNCGDQAITCLTWNCIATPETNTLCATLQAIINKICAISTPDIGNYSLDCLTWNTCLGEVEDKKVCTIIQQLIDTQAENLYRFNTNDFTITTSGCYKTVSIKRNSWIDISSQVSFTVGTSQNTGWSIGSGSSIKYLIDSSNVVHIRGVIIHNTLTTGNVVWGNSTTSAIITMDLPPNLIPSGVDYPNAILEGFNNGFQPSGNNFPASDSYNLQWSIVGGKVDNSSL